jgi:GNAT superfamily N-acetyltransferase
VIRPLEIGELDAALDLWELLMAEGESADPRYVPAPDARAVVGAYARGVWTRRTPFPAMWVAADEAGLQGYLGMVPQDSLPVLGRAPTARITDLYVRPAARRRGLGRELVEAGVQAAVAAGFPNVEVGTLAQSARAVAFWRAAGFADWRVTLLREEAAPPEAPVARRRVGFD